MISCYVELVYLVGRREARHRILLHYREIFIYKLLHCNEVFSQPSSIIIPVSRKVFLKPATVANQEGIHTHAHTHTHTQNMRDNIHLLLMDDSRISRHFICHLLGLPGNCDMGTCALLTRFSILLSSL